MFNKSSVLSALSAVVALSVASAVPAFAPVEAK